MILSLTRAIYCQVKNPKEIYYQSEDEAVASESTTAAPEPAVAAPVATVAPISFLRRTCCHHRQSATQDS